jgi:hypothetical protein
MGRISNNHPAYDNPKLSASPEQADPNTLQAQLRDLPNEIREAMQDHRDNDLSAPGKLDSQARNVVLVIIAIGIIALPVLGILQSVPLNAFAQYLAPFTGISGVAIGYIFGQARNR